MIIRGNGGFGDAIYLSAIVKNLSLVYNDITVLTNYPEVFSDMMDIQFMPFNRRTPVDIDACYCKYKYDDSTNQWQDICKAAKIKEIPFELSKPMVNVSAGGRICIVAPYNPMGIGTAKELTPDYNYIQNIIDHYKDRYHICLIGKGDNIYKGIDIDRRDVHYGLLKDTISNSSMVVTQQGWATALAEGLNVPLCVVWSHKGLQSDRRFMSSITPKKIFCKDTSIAVIDNEPIDYDRINENANIT
jgi:hypothetical protein